MDLILVRHGKAELRDAANWPDDGLRPLTTRGKRRLEEVAAGLRRIVPEADLIVTSPLKRATETAEILAQGYAPRLPIQVCKELSPGGSAEGLVAYLRKQPDAHMVMLVGHETDLSRLAAEMIGADEDAGFGFKKAGCCLIRFDEGLELGAGQLLWWLTPAILCRIR